MADFQFAIGLVGAGLMTPAHARRSPEVHESFDHTLRRVRTLFAALLETGHNSAG